MSTQQRRAIPTEDLDPELTNVSREVIGAAIEVHKALGPGFAADVYRNALTEELNKIGVSYQRDHRFPIKYNGVTVGELRFDFYVNERFAMQICSEHREIDGLDRTSLRAALRAADLELGLIVNFGERRLKDGLVRVLNPDKLNAVRDENDDQ
ncbi:MAG: GxxExxY protein [Phycisphaeraceae bacterium]|nr:GxxExxY protein [Phycisphaeraceae bacterium]MCB9847139.1 GxxExxY protein [Phycisphaeraceae bacterium]